jgi:hypothetical protein
MYTIGLSEAVVAWAHTHARMIAAHIVWWEGLARTTHRTIACTRRASGPEGCRPSQDT